MTFSTVVTSHEYIPQSSILKRIADDKFNDGLLDMLKKKSKKTRFVSIENYTDILSDCVEMGRTHKLDDPEVSDNVEKIILELLQMDDSIDISLDH